MPLDAASYELELGVSIRMLLALYCLAVGLQAVARGLEQFTDFGAPDSESLLAEFPCQHASALDRPSQGRHRIPACPRLDQLLERFAESRLLLFARLSAPARATLPIGCEPLRSLQFLDPNLNGGTRKSGGLGDGRNAPTSDRHGFGRRPATSPAFIKIYQNRRILAVDRGDQFGISHDRTDRRIDGPASMPF